MAYRRGLLVLVGLIAALWGASAFAQNTIDNYQPVTAAELASPADGDWLQYRRTYDGWGYSPLDQVTRDNVQDLRLVWARVMDPNNNESTPLVRNGVMFLAAANDVVQAIDASTGTLIWEYRRELPPAEELEVHAREKRTIALYEDKVIVGTADNYILALDAASGQVVWETERGPSQDMSIPTGPIVANGVVVAGSSCSATDNPCYITGHDVNTGEELWRNYPIPVAAGDRGDETWADMPYESRWKVGVWHAILYDPELDLIYYGSNTVGPLSPTARGTGDAALWGTNTRFAVRPKTGEIVWAHQMHPMSGWDMECTFEMPLIDLAVSPNAGAEGMLAVNPNVMAGDTRSLTVGVPCKVGTVWAFDRATGEFVYAKDTVEENIIQSVDPATGEVTINPDVILTNIGEAYNVCPAFNGGRNWPATAYSPLTHALYIPLLNLCGNYTPYSDELTPDIGYGTQSELTLPPGNDGSIGRLDAVDLRTGETLWSITQRAPRYAPVATTGGGLVFGGTLDRYFQAIDQESGEVLWQVRLPGQVTGHPISFSAGGKQYVAVATGSSLTGNGLLRSMAPDVDGPNEYSIYVFALP